MTIDFNSMEAASIPNFKGGEKELSVKMFFDGTNRIMNAVLQPGASIGMHTHETSSEIIFITQGCGTVVEDGKSTEIGAGQCHYCPKGHTHSLINTGSGPLHFLAVVPEQ